MIPKGVTDYFHFCLLTKVFHRVFHRGKSESRVKRPAHRYEAAMNGLATICQGAGRDSAAGQGAEVAQGQAARRVPASAAAPRIPVCCLGNRTSSMPPDLEDTSSGNPLHRARHRVRTTAPHASCAKPGQTTAQVRLQNPNHSSEHGPRLNSGSLSEGGDFRRSRPLTARTPNHPENSTLHRDLIDSGQDANSTTVEHT